MKAIILAATVLIFGCQQQHENPASTDSAAPTATETQAATASTTTTAAQSGDACSLITAEDLSRITGITFQVGEAMAPQGDSTRCSFTASGGTQGTVAITLHSSDASGMYK